MASQPTPTQDLDGPACSLNPGELEARLSEWRSLREDALISESVQGQVVSSLYRRSEDVARRLHGLIEGEARCCAFLEFSLYEEADAIRVDLRVPDGASVPDLAQPVASTGRTESG
jgi:hypothetical protein